MELKEIYTRDLYEGENRQFNTDKGECHSYIQEYYNSEFADKRDKGIKILEIGLAYGGSARLWKHWFINGEVYIVENDSNLYKPIEGVDIRLADGYSQSTVESFEGIEFDYIIEDGPHTFESQLFTVKYWAEKLKPGGKLILEDIQSLDWFDIFAEATPYKSRVVDLRLAKGKGDDLIFEITKIKKD